mmetsp:Transcript_89007/g.223958  ORF Transcript_89007/g.223958 Transcript_89007/m.223958 type:complete len:533 (+) Transcript_89007:92-1690(+)
MAVSSSAPTQSLANLLQQALAAHELERAELHALREEVTRLRGAATIADGNSTCVSHFEQQSARHSEPCSEQQPERQPEEQPDKQEGQELSASASGDKSSESPKESGRRQSVLLRLQDNDQTEQVGQQNNLIKFFSRVLDRMSGVIITSNIVMMWLQLEYEGSKSQRDMWPVIETTFDVLEHVFNSFFLLELFVRVSISRSEYFYKDGSIEKFNLFDMFLVLSTSLDLYVIRPENKSAGMNFTIFRPLRFVRAIRTLRVLDTLRFCMPLRVMFNAIAASFVALFWSMMLLLVVMIMAALFLCQSVQGAIREEPGVISPQTQEWIFLKYGTPIRAVWSVFEFTFSGGWPGYADTLVEDVSNLYALFFFVYIISVVFALFRIITALFLKDTMALAAKDAEVAIQQKLEQKEQLAKNLLDFFEAADSSGDGVLTAEEFNEILSNPKIKTWLSMMDLSLHETEELFTILADGDGLVSFDEFTKGVLTMRGAARSEDVMSIKRNGQKMHTEVKGLQKSVHQLNKLIEHLREEIMQFSV